VGTTDDEANTLRCAEREALANVATVLQELSAG